MFLRVKPNGGKYWYFNYYHPYSKKRHAICLGCFPDISLSSSRKTAQKYRELLAKKVDPKEHRNQSLVSELERLNTLKDVARKWLKVKETSVTSDHAHDIWRSLELHVFPHLENYPVEKIKAQTAIGVLQPLADRGSLESVKRVSQRLNEIMFYCVNTGIIESNPLAGINKAFAAPVKKHLPTIKPTELPELMKRINRASIRFTTRQLIEWQLHTMVRPSEAAGTCWDEIDFENEVWHIPATRMKKKRSHSVPLSMQSLSILREMQAISGQRMHVFPSERKPLTHTNPSTANVALKRMGYHGKLVAHGFRSIASTTLNEKGFDPDLIESALAHSCKDEVRAAYNRSDYLERRKALMRWWSNHIEQSSTH